VKGFGDGDVGEKPDQYQDRQRFKEQTVTWFGSPHDSKGPGKQLENRP
jgi:hypothetical protein